MQRLFRKWTAPGGDPLLPAQKWRFLLYVEVHQARVIEPALRFPRRRVQLFLQDGGARFPRHQIRQLSKKIAERNLL
jgi:hypothetical protein